MIMLAVGEVEDSIFKKRKDDEVKCSYCSGHTAPVSWALLARDLAVTSECAVTSL